jgi:hypothetical protein
MISAIVSAISLITVLSVTAALIYQGNNVQKNYDSRIKSVIDQVNNAQYYNAAVEKANQSNNDNIRTTYESKAALAKGIISKEAVIGNITAQESYINNINTQNISLSSDDPIATPEVYKISRNKNNLTMKTSGKFNITDKTDNNKLLLDTQTGDFTMQDISIRQQNNNMQLNYLDTQNNLLPIISSDKNKNINIGATANRLQIGPNSYMPYDDNNTYIRPGASGKDIFVGDKWTNNVNLGNSNSKINILGSLNLQSNVALSYNKYIDGVRLSGNKGGQLGTTNGETAMTWDEQGNTLFNKIQLSNNNNSISYNSEYDGISINGNKFGMLNAGNNPALIWDDKGNTLSTGNSVSFGMSLNLDDNILFGDNILIGNNYVWRDELIGGKLNLTNSENTISYDSGMDGIKINGNSSGTLGTNTVDAIKWNNKGQVQIGPNSFTPSNDNNTYLRPGAQNKAVRVGDVWTNEVQIGPNSYLPGKDGNTYIRPGSQGKDILIGDSLANNVILGQASTSIDVKGSLNLNNRPLLLGPKKDNTSGLSYYDDPTVGATGTNFGGFRPGGPVLYGNTGGGLGTNGSTGPMTALKWDNNAQVEMSGIRFDKQYTAYPDSAIDKSEISNDTQKFKQLMITGNKSGGGARTVGVWDNLNVSNNLNVANTINVNNNNNGVKYNASTDSLRAWGNSGGELGTQNGKTAMQWNNQGNVNVNGNFSAGAINQSVNLGNSEIKMRGSTNYSAINNNGNFSLNDTTSSTALGTIGNPLVTIDPTGKLSASGSLCAQTKCLGPNDISNILISQEAIKTLQTQVSSLNPTVNQQLQTQLTTSLATAQTQVQQLATQIAAQQVITLQEQQQASLATIQNQINQINSVVLQIEKKVGMIS